MLKQLQTACHRLEEGEDLIQVTIVGQAGSTPRSVGSMMFVCRDGSCVGTIGGGIVEFEMQKSARRVFDTRKATLEIVDLSGASAATVDRMICGGRLELLLEYLPSDLETGGEMRRMVTALQEGGKGYLIKKLDTKGGTVSRMEYCLVRNNSVILGTFGDALSLLPLLVAESEKKKSPVVATFEENRFFVEPTFPAGTVYIFGAGHVSRPVAQLASLVDFRTIVFDDREEFANAERFPNADRIILLSSYDNVFEGIKMGRDSYLVIVTRGHLHDKNVLEQSLRTSAGYIGMIGSKRKRKMIYDELLEKGFVEDDLTRIHNPIGLEICAETPEEIAVSIVAELIKVRAEMGC